MASKANFETGEDGGAAGFGQPQVVIAAPIKGWLAGGPRRIEGFSAEIRSPLLFDPHAAKKDRRRLVDVIGHAIHSAGISCGPIVTPARRAAAKFAKLREKPSRPRQLGVRDAVAHCMVRARKARGTHE